MQSWLPISPFPRFLGQMSTLTVLGKQVLNASQTSLEDRQPVPGIKAATIRQMVQEDIQRQIAVRQRGKEVIESAHSVRVMFVALDKVQKRMLTLCGAAAAMTLSSSLCATA